MKKLSPRTASFLKYLFAFTLLWWVLGKVGLENISTHLKEVSPMEAVGALVLVSLAQVFSALRMRYFFSAAMFNMSAKFSVILFYVGAFYNFLLPGGIGGDAYKVILVRKRMEIPAAQGIRIMVADRASGLCIIMLTMFLGLYLLGFASSVAHGGLLLIGSTLLTPLAYLYASKILLKMQPVDMVGSLRYSVVAQLFWMGALVMLWHAIGNGSNVVAFITLYCAASIASMVPVSVGGLGIKEMTYVYGAGMMRDWMGVDINPDLGVAISLCMFVLSFVASLPGLLWLNKASKADIAKISD